MVRDKRQSLITSLASSVSTRRCDATRAETISQLHHENGDWRYALIKALGKEEASAS